LSTRFQAVQPPANIRVITAPEEVFATYLNPTLYNV
jgi:hypothetical protein